MNAIDIIATVVFICIMIPTVLFIGWFCIECIKIGMRD